MTEEQSTDMKLLKKAISEICTNYLKEGDQTPEAFGIVSMTLILVACEIICNTWQTKSEQLEILSYLFKVAKDTVENFDDLSE